MDSAKNDPIRSNAQPRPIKCTLAGDRFQALQAAGRRSRRRGNGGRALKGMMMESLPAPVLIAIVLCVALWAALRKTHGS